MAMKVRRIVTGHNAAGKAVVKTDEQITAVPRIARVSQAARSGRLIKCLSTTRLLLNPPNEPVSLSAPILWATVASRYR